MSTGMFRNRPLAFVVVVVAVAACAGLCGCAAAGAAPHVSILGPWPEGGSELKQLDSVLTAFEQDNDVVVDYTGSSAVAQVLQSDVQKGTPPDIAILPSPADMARYQDELTPLDDIVAAEWTSYGSQWRDLSQAGLPHLYAVPIRAHLKGLVWYNPEHPPAPVPRTFAELSALSDELVAAGRTPWCLGVAAGTTSGWPGTDWIEDILLRQSGVDAYQQWVAGRLPWRSPEVRQAWTTWADLVTRQGQVFGGPAAALLTDYRDAARPMFAERPGCLMEHQASFMPGFYSGYDHHPVAGEDFDFFPLPPFTGSPVDADTLPRTVSADLAIVFNPTDQATALIRFLVSRSAQEKWPAARAVSASSQVPATDYDPVGRRIAAVLTGTAPLCFDGSDLMPATMRGAFYRAVLEYLSDPGELDVLLAELDEVRTGMTGDPWLTVACGQ